MKDELQRLKKATAYPEGKQLGAPPIVVEKVERVLGQVLCLDFAKGNATDQSGQGNDGTLHGGRFVQDGGKTVLRLEKGDYVDVSPSNSLDAGLVQWTIEARVKAESPNGVIMVQGGESNGYSLYLRDGVPRFALRIEGMLTEIAGKSPVGSDWVRLTAALTKYGAKLYVNGQLVASNGVGPLPVNPVEGVQIGRDTGSLAGDYKDPNPFVGMVEYARIWAGEHKVE
jgi:hypothetical protein